MTIDRAIEILDPEHREQYDSLETVKEACRMGMDALKTIYQGIKPYVAGEVTRWYACGACNEPIDMNDKYCRHCGRKVVWNAAD